MKKYVFGLWEIVFRSFFEKIIKKRLTKSSGSGIMIKLPIESDNFTTKKFEKSLKKLLTNQKSCGIIKKLVHQRQHLEN